jgi:hypothetical protein
MNPSIIPVIAVYDSIPVVVLPEIVSGHCVPDEKHRFRDVVKVAVDDAQLSSLVLDHRGHVTCVKLKEKKAKCHED